MNHSATTIWTAATIAALCLNTVAFAQAAKKGKREPVALTAAAVRKSERLYKTTAQGELFLHLVQPPEAKAGERKPAIVFFFGGGWKNGSFEQFVPQAEYLASRGMVAACADYRIESKHHTTPDKCIEDGKSAVRWLRAHADELGIDPQRIIAAGGSAGGHVAAATALIDGFESPDDDAKLSCKPNALVLFNPGLHFQKAPIEDAAGNDIAKTISPTLYLNAQTPPAILFYGTGDPALDQGREYAAKAKSLGVRADLFTAADQPHGFFNREPWTQVTAQQTDAFLTSLGYLSGASSIDIPPDAPSLKQDPSAPSTASAN